MRPHSYIIILMENKISFILTDQEKTLIGQHITGIASILGPKLITLKVAERKSLAKMKDGRVAFVKKAIFHGKSKPLIVPQFANLSELEIDFNAVDILNNFYIPLATILSQISDSMMLSGVEAFQMARTIYTMSEMGAKLNIPGAKEAYEDLKVLFERAAKEDKDDDSTPGA